jgi:hypothetical protein
VSRLTGPIGARRAASPAYDAGTAVTQGDTEIECMAMRRCSGLLAARLAEEFAVRLHRDRERFGIIVREANIRIE